MANKMKTLSDKRREKKMDVWKLEKGTVIKLLGFPYELAEDTVVLGNTPPESVKKVWKLNK